MPQRYSSGVLRQMRQLTGVEEPEDDRPRYSPQILDELEAFFPSPEAIEPPTPEIPAPPEASVLGALLETAPSPAGVTGMPATGGYTGAGTTGFPPSLLELEELEKQQPELAEPEVTPPVAGPPLIENEPPVLGQPGTPPPEGQVVGMPTPRPADAGAVPPSAPSAAPAQMPVSAPPEPPRPGMEAIGRGDQDLPRREGGLEQGDLSLTGPFWKEAGRSAMRSFGGIVSGMGASAEHEAARMRSEATELRGRGNEISTKLAEVIEADAERLEGVGGAITEPAKKLQQAFPPPEEIIGEVLEEPELLAEPLWWADKVGMIPGMIAAFRMPGRVVEKMVGVVGRSVQMTANVRKVADKIGYGFGATYFESLIEGGLKFEELVDQGIDPTAAAEEATTIFQKNIAIVGGSAGLAQGVLPRVTKGVGRHIGEAFLESGQEAAQEAISGGSASDILVGAGLGFVTGPATLGAGPGDRPSWLRDMEKLAEEGGPPPTETPPSETPPPVVESTSETPPPSDEVVAQDEEGQVDTAGEDDVVDQVEDEVEEEDEFVVDEEALAAATKAREEVARRKAKFDTDHSFLNQATRQAHAANKAFKENPTEENKKALSKAKSKWRKLERGVEESRKALQLAEAQAELAEIKARGDDRPGRGTDVVIVRDETIRVDPETYQFKATIEGGAAEGRTGRLDKVEEWDPDAPPITIHQRLDGERYVADGHQRLALYRRLKARGEKLPPLKVKIKRESAGFTVEEVVRAASLRNVQEGSAKPLDIAKLLRGDPLTEQERRRIPMDELSGTQLRYGENLAKLDDAAFSAVINGEVSEAQGSFVGEYIEQGPKQIAAIKAVKKANPPNLDQARELVQLLSREESFTAVEQDGGLFGSFTEEIPTLAEKARVIEKTKTQLGKMRRAFSNVLANAAEISEAGNTLDEGANVAKLDEAKKLLAYFDKYKIAKGSATNDAINAVAEGLVHQTITIGDAIAQVAEGLKTDIAGEGQPQSPRDDGRLAAGESEESSVLSVLEGSEPPPGESQPELPGEVGKTRETETPTPTVTEAPFALESENQAVQEEKGKKKGQEQEDLFDLADQNVQEVAAEAATFLAEMTEEGEKGPPEDGTWRTEYHGELPPEVPKATEQMRPDSILESIRKLLGIPITEGKLNKKKYAGVYMGDRKSIRLAMLGNLQTLFHETGHHTDIALMKIRRADKRWAEELVTLGAATSLPTYDVTQVLKEGTAEFMRLWMTAPKHVAEIAPEFFAEFERRLSMPEFAKFAKEARRIRGHVAGFLAQPLAQRGRMRIDRRGARKVRNWVKGVVEGGWSAGFKRFRQTWVDDLQSVRDLVEDLKGGKAANILNNAYHQMRALTGSAGKAFGFTDFGIRGRDGRFIAGSMKDALEPIMKLKEYELFGDWLTALRAVEVLKSGREPGMMLTEAQAIMKQVSEHPQLATFQQAARDVYAFQRGMLEYAVDYNVLTEEQVDRITRQGQFYVPLKRVYNGPRGGAKATTIANVVAPIHRLVGSGRTIIDPIESIYRDTAAMVDFVMKNVAMAELDDTIMAESRTLASKGGAKYWESIPQQRIKQRVNVEEVLKGSLFSADKGSAKGEIQQLVGDITGDMVEGIMSMLEAAGGTQFVDVWKPNPHADAKHRIVQFTRDGLPVIRQVHHQGLYDSIAAIGPKTSNLAMTVLGAPTRLLRATATATIGFIARNPLRDTVVAWNQSDYGFIPFVDTARGFFSYMKQDAYYQEFLRSGGAQSVLVAADRDYIQAKIRGMKETSRRDFIRDHTVHWFDTLQAISAALENATRVGELRLAIEAGGEKGHILKRLAREKSDAATYLEQTGEISDALGLLAAIGAKDISSDFSRGGSAGRQVNKVKAFFNARVQGLDRMAATYRKDKPHFAFNAGVIAALGYALYWINEDDEKLKEEPDWKRNTHWYLPVGGGKWATIAKPFEYGLFSNIVETSLDFIKTKEPEAFERLRIDKTDAWQYFNELTPTFILPLVEAAFSYDTFRDRYIVNPWYEGLDTELQYNEWTSETAKGLGPLIGLSPSRFDHLVFGYGAGMARGMVRHGIDPVLDMLEGDKPARPTTRTGQLPLVGTFFTDRNMTTSAKSLREFWDLWKKTSDTRLSINKYKSEKRYDRARERAKDLPSPYQQERLTQAVKRLRGQSKLLDGIYASHSMTPDEKAERRDKIAHNMVNIARRALGKKTIQREE